METENKSLSREEIIERLLKETGDKEVLKAKFNLEKKLKNEAYLFIIREGLIERFAEFKRSYKGDPFEDIKELLKDYIEG